jgi:general secretion pathway protein I
MRRARGFSLLEMVAAMLLLALAFTALMQVAGGALRLAGNAGDHSRAALCARSVLDGAFVLEPLRPGSWSGRLGDDCRWQLDVRPWRPAAATQEPAAPDTPLGLYHLELRVRWGAQGHERTARFSTLRVASTTGEMP